MRPLTSVHTSSDDHDDDASPYRGGRARVIRRAAISAAALGVGLVTFALMFDGAMPEHRRGFNWFADATAAEADESNDTENDADDRQPPGERIASELPRIPSRFDVNRPAPMAELPLPGARVRRARSSEATPLPLGATPTPGRGGVRPGR